MKHLILFSLLLLLSTPAFAQVKDEDKTCQSDADCAVIPIACTTCCPTYDMAEVAAVNASKSQSYAELGKCTDAHIKACGVPECGLMPTPYPATKCASGVCTTFLHPAPGQESAPDTIEGTVHQSPPEAPKAP